MNFPRFLCDATPSEVGGNNTGPNRPSFQVHAGGLEDETRQGRCSDASERSHYSVDSHTNMHQNEGFFIGSRAVMERKLLQKKRFFRQNAITTYTSRYEYV
jgi:hypothetical protein